MDRNEVRNRSRRLRWWGLLLAASLGFTSLSCPAFASADISEAASLEGQTAESATETTEATAVSTEAVTTVEELAERTEDTEVTATTEAPAASTEIAEAISTDAAISETDTLPESESSSEPSAAVSAQRTPQPDPAIAETKPAKAQAPILVVPRTPLDLEALRTAMPVNQAEMRTQLALSAYRLVGQVGYFWGGKSTALDWDSRWGTVMQVTAPGSLSTGSFRSFGLDCSGFVCWVYVNAFRDPSVANRLGYVTRTQWQNSYEVTWAEAMVGDIVFYSYPSDREMNHVGLIVERDEQGKLQIAHCSSADNNVVLVEGPADFTYVRRPYLMKDACFCTVQEGGVIAHSPECPEYLGINTSPNARDPLVWDTESQLAFDLRSLFPDAALAQAVANSLWNAYSEPSSIHNIPDSESCLCLDIRRFGYERLVDFVMAADVSVSWVGETPAEKQEREIREQALRDRQEAGAEETTSLSELKPVITSLEGIWYLCSAREIDLSYNAITSLLPLDDARLNRKGERLYHPLEYYRLCGIWEETVHSALYENQPLCPYFGGGLPGSADSYSTRLKLTGNPIQEVPERFPERILLFDMEIRPSDLS